MPLNFYPPTERYKNSIETALRNFTEASKRDCRIFALVLSDCWGRDLGEQGCELDLFVFVKKKFFMEFSNSDWLERFKEIGFKILEADRYSFNMCLGEIEIETQCRHEKWFNPEDPDFDLEVGNLFKYCKPLLTKGSEYETLANQFLPFYSEQIRQKRLKRTEHEIERLLQDIKDHGITRGDLMCGFDHLYEALRWTIQYLFIKKRTYPADYRKWLEYQFEEILKMPEIYQKIQNLIALKKLDKPSLTEKLHELRNIYDYIKTLES